MRCVTVLVGLIGLVALAGVAGCSQLETPADEGLAQDGDYARGLVFHDSNGNGRRDGGERGLAGIRVSNGRQVVKTDRRGRYRLPVDDDTIVFVIKPRGWMTGLSEDNLPRFHYIHKPNGSPDFKYPGVAPTGPLPESINFPLRPHKEPSHFKALLFGDPQPTTQQEIDYLAHDVVEECVGTDALFGVTLGDLVGDDPSLFESLARTVGLIGVPWYNVPGNHDMNYDCPDDSCSTETFQRVFGPPYYSFDFGPVHFIVLDDVIWEGPGEKNERGHYRPGLGEEQLEFVRNDLALVPKGQLVVLMMHIPIVEDNEDKAELFGILEKHPHTLSLSAHWHTQRHYFLTPADGWHGAQPHHHLVNVTACGSWWTGAPDEYGLPHTTMRDGAPNGYSIITFRGNEYSIEYKAARRPADDQMSIYAPEEVAAADAGDTEVLVNVFAGSERSRVAMRLGDAGRWVSMEHLMQEDPYYVLLKEAEAGEKPPSGKTLPKVRESPHIWRAKLPFNPPAGTHLIHVRTTDMFGQTYTGRRVIRVK